MFAQFSEIVFKFLPVLDYRFKIFFFQFSKADNDSRNLEITGRILTQSSTLLTSVHLTHTKSHHCSVIKLPPLF